MDNEVKTENDLASFLIKVRNFLDFLTVQRFVYLVLGMAALFSIGAFVIFNISFNKTISQSIQRDTNDFILDSQGIFSRNIERFRIATDIIARDRDVQSFIENQDLAVDVRTIVAKQKVAFSFEEAFLISNAGKVLFSDTQDGNLAEDDLFKQAIERSRNLKVVQAAIVNSPVYHKPVIFIFEPILAKDSNGVIAFGKVMDEEFLKKLFPTEHRGVFFVDANGEISSASIYDIKVRREIKNAVVNIFSRHDMYGDGDVIEIVNKDDFMGSVVITHLIEASFPVGKIGFFIDEAAFFNAQKKSIIVSLVIAIGIGLLFFIAVLSMRKFVVVPVMSLLGGFSKVENENFSVRISSTGLADFRNIIDGFNKAMQQVQNRTNKLNETARILEDKNNEAKKNYSAMLNVLEDARVLEKELENANVDIRSQKERSDAILRFLKSIGDGVVATDMEGKVIFFNEAAEKLTGVSNKEAMGNYVWETMLYFNEKDPETQVIVIKEFIDGKTDFFKSNERYLLKNKNGPMKSVSFSVSFIYDNDQQKQGCIMVLHDITEERELEKTKDNFLSVAAHQLRTPLSGIRWSLEMLLGGDVGKLSKDAKELVENISENNLRLIALVNDLLNVTHINEGKMNEPVQPVNVSETILSVIKSQREFAAKNKINLICTDCEKMDLQVLIGPQRFFESIENLVSNAIKYTPENGKVKITVSQREGMVEISVSDTGIGIPKGEHGKIFSKFFRAENAVHKDPEGSGLGLSVVKSFIEEADGKVFFESEEGKGTTFFISLPCIISKINFKSK